MSEPPRDYMIQNSILPPEWGFSMESINRRIKDAGINVPEDWQNGCIQPMILPADFQDNRLNYLTPSIRDGERRRELANSSARPIRVQGRRKKNVR